MRRRCLAVAGLLLLGGAGQAGQSDGCRPAEGLSFICGTGAAEEVVALPGTRWLIASALDIGAPAMPHLIDRVAGTARPVAIAFDRAACVAPDPARWSLDGLALDRRGTLYAANHGDRHTVELFRIVPGRVPMLRWIGCVPMPAGALANAIAATDEGFLVTSFHGPDDRMAWHRLARREPVSSVWKWRRGAAGLTRINTGPLSGANGIALSGDGRTVYISAWAEGALVVFDRASGRVTRQTLPFLPDNIHVEADGRLLIAGQLARVAAVGDCGAQCPQPWRIIRYDPSTGRSDTIAAGAGTAAVNYACGAQRIGDRIWITVRGDDRVAWVRAW